MRILFYFPVFLVLIFLGCQLSEVHLNELAPDNTFERVIEQQAEDTDLTINAVVKTEDDGVAIIGRKNSEIDNGSSTVFLMLLNKEGIIQSVQEFSHLSNPIDMVAIGNNQFVICDQYGSSGNSPSYSVSLTSANSQLYGLIHASNGVAQSMIPTRDTGFVIVGHIEDSKNKGFMVKIDANSKIVWEKIIENDTLKNFYPDDYTAMVTIEDIVADDNDNFILAIKDNVGSSSIFSFKADGSAASLLHKTLNFTSELDDNTLLDISTTGHYLASYSTFDDQTGCPVGEAVVYDPNEQKVKNIFKNHMNISDIQPTTDGGFLIFGTTLFLPAHGLGGPSNAILIKLDANGQEEWQQIYGGNLDDEGYQIVLLDDGGYMLIGINRSIPSENGAPGNKGIYIIRTDENGQIN